MTLNWIFQIIFDFAVGILLVFLLWRDGLR